MSRVEELPDDFDESLNLNNDGVQPTTTTSSPPGPSDLPQAGIPASMLQNATPFPWKNGVGPTTASSSDQPTAPLPPAMQNVQQHSVDDLWKELNRMPLFMTELDETDGSGGSNVALDALRAMAYEGTRAEIAENFKEQGNECVQEKNWTDAREFYTKGITALHMREEDLRQARGQNGRLDGGEGEAEVDWLDEEREVVDVEEEEKRKRKVEEACAVNRALCNLELKNYGSCNRDCALALRLNPKNIKAYYRSAQACFALDKLEVAMDSLNHLFMVDPANIAGKKLSETIQKRLQMLEAQEKERLERQKKQQAEAWTLRQALKSRDIRVRWTNETPSDMDDATLKLEDPLNTESTLSVPTLLLYPTAGQTDLIKAFGEADCMNDHLEYILPLPWDKNQEFTMATVECYMDTLAGGLIKVGRKVALGNVLAGGKTEIVDGLCRIYVVPKARVEDWIKEVKRRKK